MPSTFPFAAVIVAKKRRRIINAFRIASATSQEKAISLQELGLTDSRLFQILVRRNVIVHIQDDKYYLDEIRLSEVDRQRRMIIFFIFLFFIVIALICLQLR
jgi:hypothetical protein